MYCMQPWPMFGRITSCLVDLRSVSSGLYFRPSVCANAGLRGITYICLVLAKRTTPHRLPLSQC